MYIIKINTDIVYDYVMDHTEPITVQMIMVHYICHE